MERLLEPELMDDHIQVKAYAMADFSQSDRSVINTLEKYRKKIGKEINDESFILDIGCGPGNITELLAQHWPFARVLGIDGSTEMLTVARKRKENLKNGRKVNRLSYLEKNLSSFLTGEAIMEPLADVLVSNSLLHHIHQPNKFWSLNKILLKKGGLVFHRDLRRPFSSEKAIEIQQKYQYDSPEVLRRDFLASLHAAFTINEVRDQLDRAGLYQLKVFEVDDRYLEVVGVL
tara:strand:- start:16571 stop:17266 length:696 start_codon:yes stop_codon:yes gene_type:complete